MCGVAYCAKCAYCVGVVYSAGDSSNTTNTILTLYPLLYLTGCLFEAFSWTQDIDLATGHFARYKAKSTGAGTVAKEVAKEWDKESLKPFGYAGISLAGVPD